MDYTASDWEVGLVDGGGGQPERPDCARFIIFFLHISAFVIDIVLNIVSDYGPKSRNESGL